MSTNALVAPATPPMGSLPTRPLCQHLSGFFLINKPPGVTSHHVVSWVRRTLSLKRAGHSGTLDPFASGLLPVLVGPCTRLADTRTDDLKTYLFTLELGKTTDTLDPYGQITETAPVPLNFHNQLLDILPQFVGSISQIPPAYSALKVNGKALYEYMRGIGHLPIDISEKKRTIYIHKLELLSTISGEHPRATLRVICGKGTYIRSLARDLALTIGTVGYCLTLCREGVGDWHIEAPYIFHFDSQPRPAQELAAYLQTPRHFLPHVQHHCLPVEWEFKLRSGNPLPQAILPFDNMPQEGPGFVKAGETEFLGVWQKASPSQLVFRPQKLVAGI